MEDGIFTLWSIVHFFSGVTLASLFSIKYLKVIKFAGIFATPFIFINYFPIKIVALVIVFISLIAWVIDYFSRKGKKFNDFQNIISAFLLFVLWEWFEHLTSPITQFGIESLVNKISDIVIGFTSFILFYFLFNKLHKHKKHKK